MKYVQTLLLTISTVLSMSVSAAPKILPILPHTHKEVRYSEITTAFEERWILFGKGLPFQPWQANKSDEALKQEFKQINEWRYHAWFMDPQSTPLVARKEFVPAQAVVQQANYRWPHALAFEYNYTQGNYNASTLLINNLHFLAMENPNLRSVSAFMTLLQFQAATHLVALYSQSDLEAMGATPLNYTKNRLKNNVLFLPYYPFAARTIEKTDYALAYHSLTTWPEDQAIAPETLIALITQMRSTKSFDADHALIACHSNRGTGRTGTFIAAFALIHEIEQQLAAGKTPANLDISVQKTVMELSLQRPYLVTTDTQYIMLYRLIQKYLKM